LGASAQGNPLSGTLTPLSAKIAATATARAEFKTSADSTLEALIAQATTDGQSLSATRTARASLNDADALATATAVATVKAAVESMGVNPDQGYVAWMQGPVEVSMNVPDEKKVPKDQIFDVGTDFAISSEITWDTKNSLSGCGFFLRSNGNQAVPSQYMVLMSRVANGHILFLTLIDGKVTNFRELFPDDNNKEFDFSNGGTNTLAVVARGDKFDIWTNNVYIDTVDATVPPPTPKTIQPPPPLPGNADQIDAINELNTEIRERVAAVKANIALGLDRQLSEGLVGFMGVSRRGQTNCTFDNSWMFQITE
jgi:hypothetical protein